MDSNVSDLPGTSSDGCMLLDEISPDAKDGYTTPASSFEEIKTGFR